MTLNDCLEAFIAYQHLKGNSIATIKGYKLIIDLFIQHIGNIDVSALTAEHFNNYNLYLRGRVKIVSVRSYMRHLKVFLSFLVNEYHIDDFRAKVILPSRQKTIINILSPPEIERLLSVDDKSTFYGLRNYCMLLLMLDCGLRASEVVHLKPSDLQFDFKGIKVFGKGSKERIVPMGNTLAASLKTYLRRYEKRINVYLFVGRQRDYITRDIFRDIFRYYIKATGIERLHPHLLRHTFATNFLLNGLGDLYELSMILGHSDVSTTQIYLHIANYYKCMQHKKNFSYIDSLAPH